MTAMDVERLLTVARTLIGDLTFCIAVTSDAAGTPTARVVQPRPLAANWSVRFLTNRRCRKVRAIESTGRLLLCYDHPTGGSYVCIAGPATIVEDRALKHAIWSPAAFRWNPGGPDDPEVVFAHLHVERIELWSAAHDIMPVPEGYSAAVLIREGEGWRYEAT